MQWIAQLNVPAYPWLNLFSHQPLLVARWQQEEQLEVIDQLYKFATELKQGHNFSALVDIISKDNERVRVFNLFLSEQLKQQLLTGMDLDSYQNAQNALAEFVQNTTEILGLNLPLAVSRLAYRLRNSIK